MANPNQDQFDPDAYLAQPAPFNPDEYLAKVKEADKGVGGALSMGEPSLMADMPYTPESLQKSAAFTARYVAPVGVGLATGGLGLAPALAAGAAGAAGEYAAQKIEGEGETDWRKVAAAGVPLPVFQFAPAAGGVLSAGAKSFLATTGAQLAGAETARTIRTGELPWEGLKEEPTKDIVLRWGLPVVSGVLARKGTQFEEAKQKLEQLTAERGGGSVMLSEIQPKYTQLESNQIQSGNKKAIDLAENMDVGMGDVVKQAYGNLPPESQAAIAQDLAPYVNALENARVAHAQAQEAARAASDQLKAAQLTRTGDIASLKAASEVAENNRLLAENNFRTMVSDVFGPRTPVMTDRASVGALQRRMQNVAKQAEAGIESSLDALYQNAGLGPNDTIVSKEDVLRSISARKAAGRAMEGDISRADAEKAVELFFGDSETASLEALRKFKDVIARRLPAGEPPDAASRYASSLYDALKKSSLRYVKANYGDDAFNAFKTAQQRSAANFQAREGSVVDMLRNGDFEGFYRTVRQEGRLGNAMRELDAYASSLTRATGEAIASGQIDTARAMQNVRVAMDFKKDVNNIILNGVINESIPAKTGGLAKVSDVIDPKKLMENLDWFSRQGFPPKSLGVRGNDIADLIKANNMVGKEPLTVGKLNDFLSLLPTTKSDVAAARIAYRQAVANGMIAGGAKEKAEAFRKANEIAKKANLNEAVAQAEYQAAQADPITKFFSEKGSMLIGNGALQNSDWVEKIISKDPETISQFVNVLTTPTATGPARPDVLAKMKEAAVAYAVKRFAPTVGAAPEKLRAGEIANLFTSNNRDIAIQRENLKSILGSESYGRLMDTIVNPLKEILKTRAALRAPMTDVANDIKGLLSAEALASGKATAGVIKANAFSNAMNLIGKQYYGAIAGIWLNPQFASDLAKAGYNLDRFAQMSDRNRKVYEMYRDQDEKAKRGQPTP